MSDPSESDVSRVVAEALGLDPKDLGPDASMDTVEAWDSLQHLGVVMAIESRFGCRLSPEEVTELSSVERIYDYLCRAREAG